MTRERLLHDYYTTCTDIDIDRYTHTHTQHTLYTHNTHTIHNTTHTIHTQHTHNTHTHTHTHTYTHTHTIHTHTHIYTHNTRSGELRCSKSASYSKKRQTTLQQKCVVQQEAANYIHADLRSREAKEVEAPSKVAAPEI
jgi:hypothetical protein